MILFETGFCPFVEAFLTFGEFCFRDSLAIYCHQDLFLCWLPLKGINNLGQFVSILGDLFVFYHI